jgi:hypothetical protein
MDEFEIDLIGCISCGGTMRCPYCKGKGEKRGILFKKIRTCKKCNGTGACPFCLGDRKSWLLERMKKWLPKDLRERYNQVKLKEFELRREYDRLCGLNIQVKTFEEFYNDERYKDQMRKHIGHKTRMPEIMAHAVVMFEQITYDYELYLREVEERHRD